MTRPLSPVALDALRSLAVDPLARVHPATRAALERRGLVEAGYLPTYSPADGWGFSCAHRVTSAGHALLEGQP